MTQQRKNNPAVVLPKGTLIGVRSDSASFKPVQFEPDFNVILAERTKESTRKESRNGLGKSTLVEIISFCLGAGVTKNKGLLAEPLLGWSFTLDMILADREVTVTRNTEKHNRVLISGDTSGWPVQPSVDKSTNQAFFSIRDWNSSLGALMFGLPLNGFGRTYQPSFRSVISYSIRRGRDAFSTPFEHYRKQKEWDKQVDNAFLLGLAWEDPSDWQLLKDKKKLLDDLKSASKTGLLTDIMHGGLGELEAAKVRLEAQVREGAASLKSFRVHPQYRDLETQANRLTAEIHGATNQIIADQQLLASYEASMQEIPEPAMEEVVKLYQDVGVAFPDQTKKHLEEVKQFHKQIIDNRRRFLKGEIARLHRAMQKNEEIKKARTDERAGLLEVLNSHNALDEFNRLQQIHLEHVTQLKTIESRIADLRRFEEGKSALTIEEELLRQRTRHDLDDRLVQREQAISLFNANSEALYDAPGNLVIDVGSSGFKFEVEIMRSGSQGIDSMKVFCYDLMLAELWVKRTPSPKLLIHDSILFDGVDERQVAHALELAASKSKKEGFQYICTLNSDTIPWDDFSADFDLRSYVRLTLTDASPTGSLLGIRF